MVSEYFLTTTGRRSFSVGPTIKTGKIVRLLLLYYDLTSLYLAAHSLKYRERLGLRISLTKLSSRYGEVRIQKSPLLYLQMENGCLCFRSRPWITKWVAPSLPKCGPLISHHNTASLIPRLLDQNVGIRQHCICSLSLSKLTVHLGD